MLVVDANVLLAAAAAQKGLGLLKDSDLVGPPLLWPEARSALHVALWRGLITEALAEHALSVLESGHVRERRHPRLAKEVWAVAEALDWAKTYDAEYIALAKLLRCELATFDRRMHTAAQRVGVNVHVPA